jgi:hypothetical protein
LKVGELLGGVCDRVLGPDNLAEAPQNGIRHRLFGSGCLPAGLLRSRHRGYSSRQTKPAHLLPKNPWIGQFLIVAIFSEGRLTVRLMS